MKRFGPSQIRPHQMDEHHLFLMRLHLLMVMIKAKLKGYPAGEFRKKAAFENATELHRTVSRMDISQLALASSSHLFRERVKLLCVMATAIVSEDYPLGVHRREAVLDNIDNLTSTVFPTKRLTLFHDVLNAA